MSDDDQIDKLAKAYAKLQRAYRFQIAAVAVVAALAGLSNAVVAALTDGRLAIPNVIRFGSMTIIALTACIPAVAIFRAWERQNAEIVGLYRQLTGLAEMVDSWQPLFAMIEEAHGEGRAVVIQPAEPYQMGRPPEKLN